MSSVFRRYASNILIGELLVQSGMLTKDRLLAVSRQANSKKMQLGQVLVMGGYLTARDLQSAIEAQSLMRDKTLDLASAVRCLRAAHKRGKPFMEVLTEMGGQTLRLTPTGKLGELLLESGLVEGEQLDKAMQRSLTTGLPLGRMLVLQNMLSDTLLNEALEVQVRLRDEMLTRDEAIENLRKAAGKQAPELLSTEARVPTFGGPRRRGIRLGELLVLAGLLTETDVMNALEWGLTNQQPIGQVLVSKNLVSKSLLDAALGLQKQVDEGSLDAMQASECLAKIRHTGQSVAVTIDEVVHKVAPTKPAISYQRLLILARVVTDEDVEAAFDITSKSAQVIGRVLSMTGYIEENMLAASLRCHQLLTSGDITQDDAVAALDYCLHHSRHEPIDFDQALTELGWKEHEGLRLEGEEEAPASLETVSAALEATDEEVAPAATDDGAAASPEPSAPAKGRKFTETIAPEDPKSKHLAQMVNEQKSNVTPLKGETPGEALGSAFSRLAESYSEQGNYAEAQLVYERILVKRMNEFGSNSPALVEDLNNLAGILCVQGKFNQAEPFLRRVVAILEHEVSPDPLKIADAVSLLAEDYFRQDKYAESLPLIERALVLRKEILGKEHTDVADTLNDLARALKKLDRKKEADVIYAEAHAILAKRKAWTRLGFADEEDDA